ncbi:YheC/YheD family protein [Brevibacillus choshinensis]|uniref:YheC/YheD family protein n=1 Tax=Brevibacillus choshinensis TaxID=54911 RepID=UPI003D187B9F
MSSDSATAAATCVRSFGSLSFPIECVAISPVKEQQPQWAAVLFRILGRRAAGIRQVHSKIRSRASPRIRCLPPTAILSRKTLSAFLQRYSSVYIKPDREHTGTGIIRVWKKSGRYSFVRVKGKNWSRSGSVQRIGSIMRFLRICFSIG